MRRGSSRARVNCPIPRRAARPSDSLVSSYLPTRGDLMRQAALVTAVLLLLTGCTLDLRGTEWKKPGAMFQEVSLVETECARKAFEIGPGPDLILGGLLDVGRIAVQESRQANAFNDCMTSAGYQRSS